MTSWRLLQIVVAIVAAENITEIILMYATEYWSLVKLKLFKNNYENLPILNNIWNKTNISPHHIYFFLLFILFDRIIKLNSFTLNYAMKIKLKNIQYSFFYVFKKYIHIYMYVYELHCLLQNCNWIAGAKIIVQRAVKVIDYFL